tara:strand:- start:4761 stop:5501 length:741 start_codon:yes stop_codon:yes gene_type:complete
MKLGLSNSTNSRVPTDWTPRKFGSSLKLWLRKDTGITESDGTPAENGEDIEKWLDQSGLNNDMLDASAGTKEWTYNSTAGGSESADSENSKFFLAADGSKDITFTAGFACYARFSISAVTTGAHDLFVYDSDDTANDFLRLQTTTEVRSKINGGTKIGWTYTNPTLDSFNNWGYERDGSNNLTTYLNNSALARVTSAGYLTGAVSGNFVLDAIGGNFDGILKEVVWLDRGLTSDERTELQTYFNTL